MRRSFGLIVILFLFVGTCAIGLFSNSLLSNIKKPAIAEAYTRINHTCVYLVNPMMAKMPNGNVKIVYRIKMYDHYTIGNNVIGVHPILSSTYGEEMVIPLYNIRAIVKGKNKFKEHLIEGE